jgi:hypothetical protein
VRIDVYREVRTFRRTWPRKMALRVALDAQLSSAWRAGAAAWKRGENAPLPEMIEHQNVANKHFQDVHLTLLNGPHPWWYDLASRVGKAVAALDEAPDHLGRMRELCAELEGLVGGQALDVHCVERANYDAIRRGFGPRTKGIKTGIALLGASTLACLVGVVEGQTAGFAGALGVVYATVSVRLWDNASSKAQAKFTEAMERHVQLARLGATKQLPKLKPGV